MKRVENLDEVQKVFGDWQETILWSCLQGVMGDVFVPGHENYPRSAAAWLGDFCLFGGDIDSGLIRDICDRMKKIGRDFLIMVPQNERWADCIENTLGTQASRVIRYAIKKERDIFDKAALNQTVDALPVGFELRMIGKSEYEACIAEIWSRDLVGNYKDFETYQKLGLGVVAVCDGKIVAGASSYSSYNGGIEIEIDTKKEYRRRGLAYACGAKLILECLERGLYPSWDAQNRESVALAEKLGYHFDYEYLAYEVTGI